MLMAEYRSKYRGEEVDALLDKIADYTNPEIPEIGGGNFLTEVPDDGKVYGRTYGEWVEDDDGAVYELIEDITLEEAVRKIVRTTEPNGTPYNFKRMMVWLSKPTAAIGSSFRQVFALKNLPYDSFPFCSVSANLPDSHIAKTTCKSQNGYWNAELYCNNRNGVSKGVYGMTDDIDATGEYNRILGYKVSCTESVLFEVGTNIKIYGIR